MASWCLLVTLGVLLSEVSSFASTSLEHEELAIPDYDIVNKLFFGKRHHRRQAMDSGGSGLVPVTEAETDGSGILEGTCKLVAKGTYLGL